MPSRESEAEDLETDTGQGFYTLSAPSRGHDRSIPVTTRPMAAHLREAKESQVQANGLSRRRWTVRPFIRKASGREVRCLKRTSACKAMDDIGRGERVTNSDRSHGVCPNVLRRRPGNSAPLEPHRWPLPDPKHPCTSGTSDGLCRRGGWRTAGEVRENRPIDRVDKPSLDRVDELSAILPSLSEIFFSRPTLCGLAGFCSLGFVCPIEANEGACWQVL